MTENDASIPSVSRLIICLLGILLFLLPVSCDQSDTDEKNVSKTTDEQATSQNASAEGNDDKPPAADALYSRYCASCHGEDGTGNGPATEYLYPKPRNFVTERYKYTSTPTSQPPLDSDLHRTISNGLPGTGMPGFDSVLSEDEISSLVNYIKALSPRFKRMPEPEPIDVPEPPEKTKKLVQKGKTLYEKNACWTCHGRDGKGEGPSASGLKSDRGNPIQPRDFTKGVYKRGGSTRKLYKTIMTGIPGTGMPSYASSLTDETDRWALAYYVQSLSNDSDDGWSLFPSFVDENKKLTAAKGTLPSSPNDEAWAEVDGVRLGTFPIWTRPEPAPTLNVKAMHDGEQLAVLLTWDDPTQNLQHLKQRSFTDAVAFQLPVDASGKPPFHGMGDDQKDGMVRMWHWRAVRSRETEQNAPVGLDDVYRRLHSDRYRGLEANDEDGGDTNPAEAGMQKQKEGLQSAMDAGNPLASKKLFGRSVLEYISKGFGTLTAVPPEDHHATASSDWSEGTWTVMITRPLDPKAEQDPVLSPGSDTWIGFAAFDGAFDERNGKKSVTQWIRFHIAKE